jgi:hypothetical protein
MTLICTHCWWRAADEVNGGCYSGCSVYLYTLLLKISKYWCVWVSVSSKPLGFVLVLVFLSCLELASLMFLFACWYLVIAVLYHTSCWNTLNMCVCVCVSHGCPKKLLCFDFGFSFLHFLNCSLELAFLIFLFAWWYIVRSKTLYNFIFNPVISQFCSGLS